MIGLALLAYAAAAANAAICPRMAIGRTAPDLLAVLAMVWITLGRGEARLVIAAALGLWWDFSGSERLGIGMACFLLMGLALEKLQLKLAYHHRWLRQAAVLPAVAALEMLLAWCQWFDSGMAMSLATLSRQSLAAATYTASLSAIAIATLPWLVRQRQLS
jgi:rod shape-determining protein MreD